MPWAWAEQALIVSTNATGVFRKKCKLDPKSAKSSRRHNTSWRRPELHRQFRFGSLADNPRARVDVRSTPGSGRQSQAPARLTWANIGSANHQFDVVVTSFVNSRPTKVLVVMRASAATMLACPMKPNPRADYCGAKIAQRASNQQADGDETRATVQRALASAKPAARIVPAR
jgi:hypothetical protein